MTTLMQWEKDHDNDVRALTPKCQAILATRRDFSTDYGQRAAQSKLAAANEAHEANLRRARAVLVGLGAINDRAKSDPGYTAAKANSDLKTLRAEKLRLQEDLPKIAMRLEDARAINADPLGWAENHFQAYPALASRLPGLPPF